MEEQEGLTEQLFPNPCAAQTIGSGALEEDILGLFSVLCLIQTSPTLKLLSLWMVE